MAEWPDGTVAGRYAFIHALYQHVLYARVPVGHRVSLHVRTGERLERAYGRARARSPASSRCTSRRAGTSSGPRSIGEKRPEIALRQHGYREAADHATRALELLEGAARFAGAERCSRS